MKAKIALLVSLLAIAPSAFAISFTEIGDAGQSVATAQNTGGGILDSISGTFTSGNDVDLYNIYLSGGSFSATMSSNTDPMLFLWDSAGNPLLFNDDWFGLQSYLSSTLSAGNYILGVSQFSWGYGLHHADTWDSGYVYHGEASYTIQLQNVEGAGVPDSAATLGLLGFALGVVVWIRRFAK